MKYVIGKVKVSDDQYMIFPVIFPDHMVHATVADGLRRVMRDSISPRHMHEVPEIHSAGFCNPTADGWQCARGSESLRVPATGKPSMVDSRILGLPNFRQGLWTPEEDDNA